jgi:hypothetical protein
LNRIGAHPDIVAPHFSGRLPLVFFVPDEGIETSVAHRYISVQIGDIFQGNAADSLRHDTQV